MASKRLLDKKRRVNQPKMPDEVIFIVGPTGVGKSETAVALAKRLDGEIISADSMQIYQGMNIGTAKPSAKLLKQIPHHLIDIIRPSQSFSVFQFYKLAVKHIRQIIRRGRQPLVVGGTGFYVRSLIEGLSSGVAADHRFRKKMEMLALEHGPEYLFQELLKKDPERAEIINIQDQKRIIRALEIIEASGKPASECRQDCKSLSELGYKVRIFGLSRSREVLYTNIEKRVEDMFDSGLVKEAENLLKNRRSKTSMHAVGYKEIWECLKNGISPSTAKEEIKRNTRRYAKRQLTWFKRERGIEWVSLDGARTSDECAEIILRLR